MSGFNRISTGMRSALLCLFAVLALFGGARAAEPSRAAIASAHPLATAVGDAVLARGGNAFDAAVAVAAALAVVEPYSSGLGGGGFFLLHRAADGYEVMIDARETAPADITPQHFFDANGNSLKGASTRGGTAIAIPGIPAGLAHLSQHYGTLPLADLLMPAIRLARSGFRVDRRYARVARLRVAMLRERAATAVFLDDGHAPAPGFVLRQTDLAHTLERMAREAADGFYRGTVAAAMIATVNAAGGVWQAADLESYRVIERVPLKFTYHGAKITSASLPSAGGIALAQTLGILERYAVTEPLRPEAAHLVVEALRRAFRDRAEYLGDPDHVAVPVAQLIAKDKLNQYANEIRQDRATSLALPPGAARPASANTTHFSIIDAAGNRVAATLTINLLFGSGIVADGTGVLLNNEMDDFSMRMDVANSFQLRGGKANAVAPGKRPLSSMTPTFVEDDKGVLVLGTPGGSRIISQMLLATLLYVHSARVDLPMLVASPRYHHQYWPDQIEIEGAGFTEEWRRALEGKGHRLRVVNRRWGNMQAVFRDRATSAVQAVNDPRGGEIGWY